MQNKHLKAFNELLFMIYDTAPHTAPGDKKMMEAVNLKEESRVSCPSLRRLKVLYRDYCAVQGNVGHKMWSWYCDRLAVCD